MMKFELKAYYQETMANLSTKIKGVVRDDHALKVQAENVLNPKIEGNVENDQGINVFRLRFQLSLIWPNIKPLLDQSSFDFNF